MDKSGRLRLADVRATLRLVGECRDLGYDPALWRRHAYEGVGRLIGARVVAGGEFRWRRPDGPIAPFDPLQVGLTPAEFDRYFLPFAREAVPDDDVLFAHLRADPGRHVVHTRRRHIPDGDWYRCRMYVAYHEPVGLDECVASVWELPGDRADVIGLHRDAADRDFSPRERRLLRLFHAELGRLIGPILVSSDDAYSPTRLPPRVRETLQCLLDGDSEKQAAARMNLSRETVHEYVKVLYRHYRVASRAELLSRVLRRPTAG